MTFFLFKNFLKIKKNQSLKITCIVLKFKKKYAKSQKF